MYNKAAEIDLECYDEPNYYNEFVLSVSEAEKSMERFLVLLNSFVQSVTIMLTTGVFFLVTDAAVVLFNRTSSLRKELKGFVEMLPKASENSMYIDKIRCFLMYEPKIKHNIGERLPI